MPRRPIASIVYAAAVRVRVRVGVSVRVSVRVSAGVRVSVRVRSAERASSLMDLVHGHEDPLV